MANKKMAVLLVEGQDITPQKLKQASQPH